MRGERTAKHVFDSLLKQADVERFFIDSNSGRWMHGHTNEAHERFLNECGEAVGELVLKLPESDREILKNMSSDDLESFGWVVNGWYRARPEKINLRKRGPISLRK